MGWGYGIGHGALISRNEGGFTMLWKLVKFVVFYFICIIITGTGVTVAPTPARVTLAPNSITFLLNMSFNLLGFHLGTRNI